MLKSISKQIIKRVIRHRAFDPVRRLRPVKRALGTTALYPEWVRDLRGVTASWKATSPAWGDILRRDSARWEAAKARARTGPRVLIATSSGGFFASSMIESMLAVALTLRGAQPHILLCDQHLPACLVPTIARFPDTKAFAKDGPSEYLCSECVPPGYQMFRALGVPVHRHSELISAEEFRAASDLAATIPLAEIARYTRDGVPVGDQALAGALRFYGRADLDGEPESEAIFRRYFLAALLSLKEFRRLLQTHPFECALFSHGVYVPFGVFNAVARTLGVRSVTWSPSYRRQTFVFSHDDSYHHTLLSEPTVHWEAMPWTPEMEGEIVEYLKSRWQGTHDWISYQLNTQDDVSRIAAELGVDFAKPCIGMLTNVAWDAQVHYPANAFSNMIEWMLQTIRYFSKRPDLQLIIRVHPAEVQHGFRSRQPAMAEIRRAFPALPKNIFVIPPEQSLSTYAVMLQCNAVIIYGTKMGLELASMGMPVIVAGEAWVRNKGITLDASSPEEYFRLLDRLPLGQRLSAEVTQRARRYAYHFFFRRMIPLPFVVPPWPYRLELAGLDDLMPGRNPGLDVICDGILKAEEFIYPAEARPGEWRLDAPVAPRRDGRMTRVGAV